MLEHLGEQEAAERVENAVESVISAGETLTRDLGGQVGTREFTRAVIETL
jgi:isocitrate dehydrogenase (NAD+)